MSIFDLFRQIDSKRGGLCSKPEFIIAFLGNPGKEYEGTRHNAGFFVSGIVEQKYGVKINRAKFDSLTAEISESGRKILLLKPQTYMNLSGRAVLKASSFYKIPAENIIAVCDDVNLDVGSIRVRRKGSDGGQKGLRSIIDSLGSDGFPRVRVGVGKKPGGGELVSWVLGKISAEQTDNFAKAAADAAEAALMIADGRIEEAMSRFN
ncbi:MAG: aminoacyl-tRNA hydrolase [Clostridia bacterium]|nr:aminoacyl-tRNA hydrolase [Clostridia bacterium]